MFRSFLIAALMIITPLVNAVDHTNLTDLMQYVTDHIFSRLQQEQTLIKQNPEQLRVIVREELIPYVHIKYAGALVLGTYYKQATAAQLDAYFPAFKEYIEQAYAQVLTLYRDQRYEITSERFSGDATIAPIRVIIINNNGQPPIRLDFQWRKNSQTGDWQAYDMIAEGVSMIMTKQNEWAEILRQQGIDGLTKQLLITARQPILLDKK